MNSLDRISVPALLTAALLAPATLLTPAALTGQAEAPATGFALSASLSPGVVHELANTVAGGPAFTLGHRGERLSIGLGLGFTRLTATDRDSSGGFTSEGTQTATAWSVGPDVLVRVWQSADGATLGHLALGGSIGRFSAKDENRFSGPPPSSSESSVSGTVYGLRAGLAGERFLGRNLSLGVEGGLRTTFTGDLEEEGSTQTFGLGVSGAYASLRLSVVLGS